ncbi:ATP-binding protein [Eubacterium ramulus]
MTDREGNLISLSKTPNPNTLVWGKSGYGKTFFCYRKVEEAVAEGESVLIIDYSGSYTRQEMERANFKYYSDVREFNLYQAPFYWISPYKDEKVLVSDIADTLVSVLAVRSYRQEKLLHEAVIQYMRAHKNIFNVADFISEMEQIFASWKECGKATDDLDGLEKLLSRLFQYKTMGNFFIMKGQITERCSKKVWLLQLSDFPESEKKFLAESLITLFWKETRHGMKKFNVMVLDEFQFLRLQSGEALISILREGRKYDLSVVLSTQFISHFSKQELESLLQAGNIVIFKPSSNDMHFSAKMLGNSNKKQWEKVLSGLEVGEALLHGHYMINGRKNVCEKPIVLRI